MEALRSARWRPSPRRAVLLCILAPVVVLLLLVPLRGVPAPEIEDEFGSLLVADTLAHGRLSNPPLDDPAHFETVYVLTHPRYASIYPPAMGAFMAAGQKLGHPWLGVVLATGLAAGAVCWMLQAYLPPGWALLGGLLTGMKWGAFRYWGNSYWGGSVSLLAGALVLGAVPRVVRGDRRAAAALGLGLGLLLLNRPYEGFLLGIAVLVALGLWLRGLTPVERTGGLLRLLPAGLVLAVSLLVLAIYDRSVTGSAALMPYQLYFQQYGIPRIFVWAPPLPEPRPFNPNVLLVFRWLSALTDDYRSDFAPYAIGRIFNLWLFYVGAPATIALVGLPAVLKERRHRFLAFAAGVLLAGTFALSFQLPHYLAPGAPAVIGLLVASMAWVSGRGRAGRLLVLAILLAEVPILVTGGERSASERSRIADALGAQGGRHLVFVRYAPRNNFHSEWVYNGAVLDEGTVLWARSVDPASDGALAARFPGRRAWLAETAGTGSARLSAYSRSISLRR